jgi:hypothetical protein
MVPGEYLDMTDSRLSHVNAEVVVGISGVDSRLSHISVEAIQKLIGARRYLSHISVEVIAKGVHELEALTVQYTE